MHIPRPYCSIRARLVPARPLRLFLPALLLAASGVASAQLRLPQLNLPQRPGALELDALRQRAEPLLNTADLADRVRLDRLRLTQAAALLAEHRDVLEPDPAGFPVVRRELLAWSPSQAGLAAARAAGLELVRQEVLDGLEQAVYTLRVPAGADTAATLERLRAADPDGVYDFNHVYTGSGAAGASARLPAAAAAVTALAGSAVAAAQAAQGAARGASAGTTLAVGLIDSGVDAKHAVFRDARLRRWGCNDTPHPAPHGTAVAALMVGESERFRGVAPGATLYAADIYCDSPTGGSAAQIAQALAWLAREQVGVINVSLVGPANRMLERVVAAMVQRGHLLVAAVGNDGPAAPPLYPASYPGVVGVSAVDKRGRPLPEAARGPQVMFAAPGGNMITAAVGEPPYRQVRGTSFAAPVVAALLAPQLGRPDTAAAKAAIAHLVRLAGGDGTSVSNETGYGIVGAAFRVDPARFK